MIPFCVIALAVSSQAPFQVGLLEDNAYFQKMVLYTMLMFASLGITGAVILIGINEFEKAQVKRK